MASSLPAPRHLRRICKDIKDQIPELLMKKQGWNLELGPLDVKNPLISLRKKGEAGGVEKEEGVDSARNNNSAPLHLPFPSHSVFITEH